MTTTSLTRRFWRASAETTFRRRRVVRRDSSRRCRRTWPRQIRSFPRVRSFRPFVRTPGRARFCSSSRARTDHLDHPGPACRLNFGRFFCSFTCSPDQSLFLTVTSTQTLKKDGKDREAVKSVEFAVAGEFGEGFFDACKDVKFGATNGFAMDLIGGAPSNSLSVHSSS